MKKSVISLILVLAFLLSALPSSAWAATANGDEITPADDSPPHEHVLNVGCQAAIDANVGNNPVEFAHTLSTDENGALLVDGSPANKIMFTTSYGGGVYISPYALEPGNYYLTADCRLNASIVFSGNGDVNLCLNGHQITRNNSDKAKVYSFIYVNEGINQFNLCDCIGAGAVANGNVTNAHLWTSWGGGIHIVDGAFTMFSGNITGSSATYGGGIYLYKGTVTMYGGTISGNASVDYGGGIYISNGTVTMCGGTISKNTASRSGGGVYNGPSGSFALQGGTITENSAGKDPTDGFGGGIYSSGTFKMLGGEVSGNSSNRYGGGVHLSSGSSSGRLEMTGGTISGNKAGFSGAGINLSAGTNLHLSGGAITSNVITGGGNGAGISGSGSVYLSGSPVVYDNKKGDTQNNLYLPTGNQVNFEAGTALSSGAQIGITTENTPGGGTSVPIFDSKNAQKNT